MNARMDVDVESDRDRERQRQWEREREGETEKKREMKKEQIARYFFYGIQTERLASLCLLLFISSFVFLSLSLSDRLSNFILSPLKRQKFLTELLFFAGDFLELQKKKTQRNFSSRRHSTSPTCIPDLIHREFFDYKCNNITREIAIFSHDHPSLHRTT